MMMMMMMMMKILRHHPYACAPIPNTEYLALHDEYRFTFKYDCLTMTYGIAQTRNKSTDHKIIRDLPTSLIFNCGL